MEEFSSQIINHEINNEHKILLLRFDNNLIYIFILIIRIIILVKAIYFENRREDKLNDIFGIKNQIKMANIINNNTIIRNYRIITLSILISILCRIKNNIFDLYYFQYSKITLKIKGIGSI